MKEITEKDFQVRFDEYWDAAHIEPVAITKDDKPQLVLISYEEYIDLRHKAGIQQAIHVGELSKEDIKAIADAKMPAGLDHLNDELED